MAGLGALALAVLHLYYPLPYVFRVMMYRGPDFSDIHRFEANRIAASSSPQPLPMQASDDLVQAIGAYPGVGDVERFLQETETSAFVVLRNGRIAFEWYAPGSGVDTLQNSFSVSKSVLSALVGLAADGGLMSLSDPVTVHLPELLQRDARFADITLGQLLDMRSGVRFNSDVRAPFFTADNAIIYYHPDIASVVLERTRIASAPGEFQYNNYNSLFLGLVLRRATGGTVAGYLEHELWQPMGAEHAAGWSTDDRGVERGESGFHGSARDLAKFGLLYLRDGRVDGEQVLPAAWVRASTQTEEPVRLERYDGGRWAYRAGWWIVPRPEGRPDFTGIGRIGQFVYVSPQHDTVFVRTGPGRGDWGDRDWTRFFYASASAW